MHYIAFGKIERYIPTAWNELTPRQLRAVTTALYSGATGHSLVAALLASLLDWPRWLTRAALTTEFLDAHQERVAFLLDACQLTTQLLPTVRPLRWPWRRLYGPADGLSNVELLEFIFADALFLAAHQSGADPGLLDQFLAVLYRPRRSGYDPDAPATTGDPRQPFNRHLIERHARQVAPLPLVTKYAIALWYRGCRDAFEARYPWVFDGAGGAGEKVAPVVAWDRARRSLAGTKFGDLATTDRAAVSDVLAEMNDALHRQARHAQTSA
jgi:hypothetical protein